jgi:hypothetical protein
MSVDTKSTGSHCTYCKSMPRCGPVWVIDDRTLMTDCSQGNASVHNSQLGNSDGKPLLNLLQDLGVGVGGNESDTYE